MNYQEALKYKNKSVKEADESVTKLYHILIAPSDKTESVNYIHHFLKNPKACKDDSCKEFSSDGNFEVVSVRKDDS